MVLGNKDVEIQTVFFTVQAVVSFLVVVLVNPFRVDVVPRIVALGLRTNRTAKRINEETKKLINALWSFKRPGTKRDYEDLAKLTLAWFRHEHLAKQQL